MSNKPLVVYFTNAIHESVCLDRQITSDSPAATNKVFGLVGAMRCAEINCIVLSLGRGRQNGEGGRHRAVALRHARIPVLYCSFWHVPILTHIVTAISMLLLSLRLTRRNPQLVILSYNRVWHYIPALVVMRMLRIRSFLDLEDGFIVGSKGINRFKNVFVSGLFRWLCSDGAMVANFGLRSQLHCSPSLVCYGVAENVRMCGQDWESDRLKVLFSGTLLEEVGCALLIQALEKLQQQPELVTKMHMTVTGKGPYANAFRAFAAKMPGWLSFGEALPKAAYTKILRASHVGLSLRLHAFEMSGTTFPSKVVEYAQNGLVVVTTRTSDVPLLFGSDAVFLEEETPEALAELLATLPSRRAELRKIAYQGRDKVMEVCDPKRLGEQIKQMIGV